MASPSIKHETALSESAARAISWKRPVQSCPLRVKSRTPAASRRTSIRKPSCLICAARVESTRRTFSGQAESRHHCQCAARVAPEDPVASGLPRGSPRCASRDAAMLSTSPPEQAFAETLLYLADDWGHLAPEQFARFLCESCQGNAEIKAFCRTIALHFRAK